MKLFFVETAMMAKQHRKHAKTKQYFEDVAKQLRLISEGFASIAAELEEDQELSVKAIPTLELGLANVRTGFVRAKQALLSVELDQSLGISIEQESAGLAAEVKAKYLKADGESKTKKPNISKRKKSS